MLTLDPREGSGDLAVPLRQLGVPVTVEHLEFGDVQIVGRGPEERPVLVGIEIKKVPDLIQSMLDARLIGYQLPGLIAAYEIPVLLIEGAFTADEHRRLVVLHGKRWAPPEGGTKVWTFEELEERLFSITHRAGVVVDKTVDRRGTAAWLAAIHRWLVGKPWEEHSSHTALRLKTLKVDDPLADYYATTKMKVVAQLARGIGTKKARAISDHFASPQDIFNAEKEELMKVEGVGKELAQRIWAEARRRG